MRGSVDSIGIWGARTDALVNVVFQHVNLALPSLDDS
jgi:hypothetical protein